MSSIQVGENLSLLHAFGHSFVKWLFIQSIIHSPMKSSERLAPVSVFRSPWCPSESGFGSPEIFILEAVSTGDKWEAFTVFSVDGFPYLFWFG